MANAGAQTNTHVYTLREQIPNGPKYTKLPLHLARIVYTHLYALYSLFNIEVLYKGLRGSERLTQKRL